MLMNSKKFAQIIEGIVKDKRISYLDAVLHYCENNDIDTASVGPLINKSLKEKIKAEAGIESKNEILPESTLLNFKNLAAVIVMPALLTPGINASI